MKNLCLWRISTRNFLFECGDKLCTYYGHHEDSAVGELFLCSRNLVVCNLDSSGNIKWTKDLSDKTSSENAPVNITFLGLDNTVSVGFTNGELFTISDFGNRCDLVGVCDNGLLAMEWSPDQELLVLVTKELKVILMSYAFDPIKESDLLIDDFGEKQFIAVGWGKKETQFHGSEGKQAAKTKTEVVVGNDTEVDNKVAITWKGDGHLFAVGFKMEGIRRFKVFDREGNLQFTSEKQLGLEANLSWRPSGSLISTTQKLPDKYTVSFFEKNGLKHGEFTIPVNSNTIVKDILWSCDSEILTLLCLDTIKKTQTILLFTSSNYHWYLKQTLHFNEQQSISKILWYNDFNIANNKKMHIVFQNGQHYIYTWIWDINHSKGKSDCDDAVVAVIDGKKILISAFRYTSVPPPMANTEIELEDYIDSIHFAPENSLDLNSNSFAVKTKKYLVFLQQTLRNPLRYEIYQTLVLEESDVSLQLYNWYWSDQNRFICTSTDDKNCYQLIQYDISDKKLLKESIQSLPSSVTRISCHPILESKVFLQMDSGDILEYNSDGTITPQDISFPEMCPYFNVISIDNDVYFMGLSHTGLFYINGTLILSADNVSSFYVHTNYLLLTTLKHVLLCTELTKSGLDSIKRYDKTETLNVYKRKIERGAELIIAVPKDTRTVFQMPRGNLETIQPRPLSLKIIGEYLDSCKYYEAFDLMRKQRINLNLIYDHDPKLFSDNLEIFFNSIQNNSWLNLFLSDLENVDITKTMYANSYPERKNTENDLVNKKIQHVCDIIAKYLHEAPDSSYRILPLLTTYIKRNSVNDLEEALNIIKSIKEKELLDECKPPVSSDEALKYLLYMVNVDYLFDVALGMYDFDLVLLVANKSQKDPKDYIAMLNELNEMDENYKRFTINKHLKRFDKAVQCLAKCGQTKYGELRTFVKYHSLYREALTLFCNDDDIYKEISDDFGLYLKLKKQYVEAGIIYERANNYSKAIECYKDALEWELALKLAKDIFNSKEQFKQFCWDLAGALKEEKRHKEALSILEQFDNDSEDIIIFALDSGQFKTAYRYCIKFNKEELIGQKLIPSLLLEYENTKDLLETNWTKFSKYRNRLQTVRDIKKNKPVNEYEISYGNKDSDLYSDAGSTIASSSGSGRSYRSSKNRRKHERKVAALKEGSQYEDIALVMALHSLVSSTYELRLQVKETNIALCCLGKDAEALTLQSSLEKMLKEMKDSFSQIWSYEFLLEATYAATNAEIVSEGSSGIPQAIACLEPHLRIAPVVSDVQWKLEGFE